MRRVSGAISPLSALTQRAVLNLAARRDVEMQHGEAVFLDALSNARTASGVWFK